jgi:hypothetical protein
MVPLRFLTAANLAAVMLCSAAGAQQPLPRGSEAIAYRPGRVIALHTNPTTLPRVGSLSASTRPGLGVICGSLASPRRRGIRAARQTRLPEPQAAPDGHSQSK